MAKTAGLPSFSQWLVCTAITIVVALAVVCVTLPVFHQTIQQAFWTVVYCLVLYHVSIYLRVKNYWPYQKPER